MNYANLETSERLQRLLRALADGEEHSTRELIVAAEICAVNSAICELRAHGLMIHCRPSKREGSASVAHWYRLDLRGTLGLVEQWRRAAARCEYGIEEEPEETAIALKAQAQQRREEADRVEALVRRWIPESRAA